MGFIDDTIKNKANEGLIAGDKPMTTGVATALIPNILSLDRWSEINTRAFNNPTTKSSEYMQAKQRLENVIRTNPQAAVQSVEMYNTMGPKAYQEVMVDLANNMAHDPKFAKAVVAGFEKSPGSLQSTMQAYKKAMDEGKLEAYIADAKGEPAQAPAASPPSGKTVTAAPPKPPAIGKTVAKADKGKKADGALRPVPAANAPTTGNAGATVQDTPDQGETYEEGTPRRKLNAVLANPKNKEFADLVGKKGLKDKMAEIAEKNPDRLKTLSSPGTMAGYLEALKQGDDKKFLAQFEGPKAPDVGGMQAGMGGLGDLMKDLGGMFGGLFGADKGPNSFGGMFQQLSSIASRIFGGNGMGILGGGTNLARMLDNPNNPPMDPAYLAGHAHQLQQNLQSGNDAVRRHAQRGLAELGITDRGTLHELQQGRQRIDHVGIEAIAQKDDQGNVTGMKHVAKAHVVRYEGLEQVKVAGRANAANDPSVEPPKQVAGSDVTRDPNERKNSPSVPAPTGGGDTA